MNHNQKIALTIDSIFVVVFIILSVIAGSFWGWQRGNFGMMGTSMMGGFDTTFFMAILWIVVLGLIIWAVVAALKRSEESASTDQKVNPSADSSMDILKRRYALGEIDKEEFEVKKKDLV